MSKELMGGQVTAAPVPLAVSESGPPRSYRPMLAPYSGGRLPILGQQGLALEIFAVSILYVIGSSVVWGPHPGSFNLVLR